MKHTTAGLLAGLLCAMAPAALAAEPDFMSGRAAWQLNDGLEQNGDNTDLHAIPGDPYEPVRWALEHPYHGNGDLLRRPATPRIADIENPILKPWTRAVMQEANEHVLKTGVFPFTAEQRCWPGGVPGLLLYPAEPVFYLQTPKQVWFFTQRDHQIRRIHLDRTHSANPGYSWYGESVGHYELGDTLVVDTVGLDDKGPVDNYRTPHTKKIHVVERHQVDALRANVHVTITVDDPGAFTAPWRAWKNYARVANPKWEESICAENNADYFDEKPVPLPHATKLNF